MHVINSSMRCAICIQMVGLLVTAVSGGEPRTPPADPPRFTLATFNVNWGNVDLDETVAVIRRTGADIVALQEITPEAERCLRNALRQAYPHMAFRAAESACGFGFLSKHPLTEVKYLEPKFGFLGTYLATATVAARRIQLVNVHLEPDRPREGEGVLRLLKRFRDLEATHLKEIRRIAEQFDKNEAVVILGDFNSLPEGSAPTFLKERGYADSAAEAHGEGTAPLTWHWRLNGADLRYRLDYIFLPKGVRTVENQIVTTTSSDHVPVVSRVEWSDEVRGRP